MWSRERVSSSNRFPCSGSGLLTLPSSTFDEAHDGKDMLCSPRNNLVSHPNVRVRIERETFSDSSVSRGIPASNEGSRNNPEEKNSSSTNVSLCIILTDSSNLHSAESLSVRHRSHEQALLQRDPLESARHVVRQLICLFLFILIMTLLFLRCKCVNV